MLVVRVYLCGWLVFRDDPCCSNFNVLLLTVLVLQDNLNGPEAQLSAQNWAQVGFLGKGFPQLPGL